MTAPVPTPGPLTADVALLPGDVLSVTAKPSSWFMAEIGNIVSVVAGPDHLGHYEITPNGQWYSPEHLAFIARPGVWVAHDGGPNPVPGMVVEVKTRIGPCHPGRSESENWQWSETNRAFDIIAYRIPREIVAGRSWKDALAKAQEIINVR